MKRGAGILMPIISLPSNERFASFKDGYAFVDFLSKTKHTYWQVLPINDVDEFASPFCSTCFYSGNPLYIDLTGLVDGEMLKKISNKKIGYEKYKKLKMDLLFLAFKYNNFDEEIEEFEKENKWLTSYSEFMVIKEEYQNIDKFPLELKNRNSSECNKYLDDKKERVKFYKFIQYLFFKQWMMLKEYANSKGIFIIGDSPIYSAMDSKEAWADSDMYLLDENLTPSFVAGVPPDYFSETGQVWNTLIYNYEKMKENDYKYLIDKYKYLLNIYDYLKIDHFRGLEYYYMIPFGEVDGKKGEWKEGPGYRFIDLLKNNNINNLILEDLGIISEGVVRLKDYSGYPGMKVYEFAFGEDNSPFLPENYIKNCVAYTGTHDNDTLYSFLSDLNNREKVSKYLNVDSDDIEKVLLASINKLYNSDANVVIINPQDLLMEGSDKRFNTPGTIEGNWLYCCDKKLYSKKNEEFLLTQVLSSRRG